MVIPKVPNSKRNKRRPRSPSANQTVDSRVLLIPLGLAGLAVAWNILRLFRSLVRPTGGKPVLRREHAPFSSWNYDWCQQPQQKLKSDEAPYCLYVLPIDLEDFLPPLPDEPLMDMFPDPADLFDANDDNDSKKGNQKKNATSKELTDDLDNHIDRLGNMLLNPANYIMYPPTPKILLEARRNLTLSGGNKNNSSTRSAGVNTGIKGDHFALISRRGKGDTHDFYNQDRAVLIDPFPIKMNGKQPKPKKGGNPLHNNFFMAIFDGHGLSGHVKADHAASTLPKILLEQLKMHKTKQPYTDHQIRQSIQSSFWDTHRQGPLIHDSGCTASTIVRIGHHLYFANAGDSRSMLVQVDMETRQFNITHKTTPHKPNDPEERQRIVKTGCIVIDPIPFHDATARVADKPDDTGSLPGLALAMSRSLGDYDLEHCSVIPEPTITMVDLAHHEKHSHRILLAVSVSDGLFDEVPLEEIAQGLSRPYLNRNTYLGQFASPLELAAEDLVRTASDRWLMNTTMLPYRDDITIAVRQVQ